MNYYKIRLELNLCLMNLIYSIGNVACSSKLEDKYLKFEVDVNE